MRNSIIAVMFLVLLYNLNYAQEAPQAIDILYGSPAPQPSTMISTIGFCQVKLKNSILD